MPKESMTRDEALEVVNHIEDEAETWPNVDDAECLWRAAYLLRQKYRFTVDDEN